MNPLIIGGIVLAFVILFFAFAGRTSKWLQTKSWWDKYNF